MHDEPRDIPPLPPPEEVTGRAVAALILGVSGLVHACPCIGPVLAIALGFREKSGVGKAAVILGIVTLVLDLLVIPALVVRAILSAL